MRRDFFKIVWISCIRSYLNFQSKFWGCQRDVVDREGGGLLDEQRIYSNKKPSILRRVIK